MASHRSFQSLRAVAQLAAKSTRPTAHRSLHSSRPNAAVYPKADLATLKKILAGSQGRIVLVDFYADWCGPCHQLSPILEGLASEGNSNTGASLPIDLVKIDTETDHGQELGAKHKVRALPTVIAYKDGKEASQFVGALSEAQVKKFLENL